MGGGIAYEILTQRRLEDSKCLELSGFKVYSQNDEDGIIEEIFNRISTTNKKFVEFGVQNGVESNSHYLLHKGWNGFWIEGNKDAVNDIQVRFAPVLQTGQLKCRNAFITRDNINLILADGGMVGEIDLLSIDIDGNDYYIWEAINIVRPRVVVIEYNAKFPPNYDWKMAYCEKFVWDGSDWFGASLKALEILGRKLGYQLVGTNLIGVNAFFVREEIAGDLFIKPATAENLYNPARYSELKYISGHPAKFCLLNQLPNIGILNYNQAEYRKQKISAGTNKLPDTIKNQAAEKFQSLGLNSANAYIPRHTHSKFFLPNANTDLIQQVILATDNYFEINQLEEIFYNFKGGVLSKILAEPESVVVDIGANIGNHTLYFANELHAGKVISFEAVKNTFEILNANVKLNNLQDKVQVYNLGLSNKRGKAAIGIYNAGNMGGTSLVEGSGDIELATLDEFELPKVNFIKIDVEGMEPQVLQGAIETIKRTRPFILVESFEDKAPLVEDFMKKLDYRYYKKPNTDYLFYPAEYENYHDAELENYDIIIPVVKSHVEQLSVNLEFINKNLGHDKIILVCSEKTFSHFKDRNVEFLNGNDILPGMSLETVQEMMVKLGGNPARAGWYFQQFLKMYYAFVCKKKHYLVWDADVIPTRPIYFVNNRGENFFNMMQERHVPYFETMTKLFNNRLNFIDANRTATPSFISGCMIIETAVMRELVSEIGGENFWKNILYAINPKDLGGSGFSEFETYGTYLLNKYTKLLKVRPLVTQRDGMAIFKKVLKSEEMQLLPYDMICFENWQR